MKVVKIFIYSILICIILTSCNFSNNKETYNPINPDYKNNFTETIDDCKYVGNSEFLKAGEKLLFSALTGINDMPFSYVNEKTGNVIAFCIDSTCLHGDENCPYFYFSTSPYFSSQLIYKNNYFYYYYIYFNHQKETRANSLVCMDEQGQNKKLIYDFKDEDVLEITPIDDYIYFIKPNMDGIYNIYRLKNGSDKLEFIDIVDGESHVERLVEINGDLYYQKYVSLYKLSKDLKTSELIAEKIADKYQFDKNYLYYRNRKTKDNNIKPALIKIDLETKEETVIRENVDYFFITDDNIYFSYNSDVVINGPNISNNVEDRINGKIYRMDKNGENEELVFEAENLYIQDYAVYGDYIYMYCDGYDSYFANKGAYKLCRVNIFSDEKKLVEVTRDNKFNEFIIPTPVNIKFVSGN